MGNPQSLAQARVLLLDSGFQPSQVVTWQGAMTRIAKGSAIVVATYDNLAVHTVSESWPCPAVISSRGRSRARRPRANFSRRNVFARDGYCCQYCGEAFEVGELTLDHVMPKSRGGRLSWENATTACVACNTRKANRTPREAGMSVLNVPCVPGYMSFADLHDITTLPDVWAPFLAVRGTVAA